MIYRLLLYLAVLCIIYAVLKRFDTFHTPICFASSRVAQSPLHKTINRAKEKLACPWKFALRVQVAGSGPLESDQESLCTRRHHVHRLPGGEGHTHPPGQGWLPCPRTSSPDAGALTNLPCQGLVSVVHVRASGRAGAHVPPRLRRIASQAPCPCLCQWGMQPSSERACTDSADPGRCRAPWSTYGSARSVWGAPGPPRSWSRASRAHGTHTGRACR